MAKQYGTISSMSNNTERGMVNILLIPLILSVLLFLGAVGFGVWAYTGMQDYKNNTDQKVAVAVEAGKKEESNKKDLEFADKEKYPLQSYIGPSPYGSPTVTYSKKWSGYVVESVGSIPVDGYFYPHIVPGVQTNTQFAMRLQVFQGSYSTQMRQFESFIRSGKVQVTPYRFAKQPDTLGSRVDGQLTPTVRGSMVLVPLRDKTLKIWTESDQFISDFNNIILPSVTFTP